MNILIVEDDPMRMKLFRRGLIGSVVHHADTAKAGMYLAATEQPDVVFLDYDLHIHAERDPKHTGSGGDVADWVAREFRKTQGGYQPVVIIHSYNPMGHAIMADLFHMVSYPTFHHTAGAWLEVTALDTLIATKKWHGPHRLPSFTKEFGW